MPRLSIASNWNAAYAGQRVASRSGRVWPPPPPPSDRFYGVENERVFITPTSPTSVYTDRTRPKHVRVHFGSCVPTDRGDRGNHTDRANTERHVPARREPQSVQEVGNGRVRVGGVGVRAVRGCLVRVHARPRQRLRNANAGGGGGGHRRRRAKAARRRTRPVPRSTYLRNIRDGPG